VVEAVDEHQTAVFVLTLTMAAMLAGLCVGRGGTILALSVFSLASGLSFPIQRQLLNEAIVNSATRATLLSIESIIDRRCAPWLPSCWVIISGAARCMHFFCRPPQPPPR